MNYRLVKSVMNTKSCRGCIFMIDGHMTNCPTRYVDESINAGHKLKTCIIPLDYGVYIYHIITGISLVLPPNIKVL